MTTAASSGQTSETRIEGLAAAALLAAGSGAFVLGLLTTLAEASTGIKDFLQFNDRVGPLSGKTIIAAIAYFGALLVFALPFRGRQLALRPVLVAAVILLVLGLVGTFPTFFQAFA
jgi:hypothetical protein